MTSRKSDAFVPMAIIGIVLMMVLPVPPGLLDILIALSMALQHTKLSWFGHFVALVPFWAVWPYEAIIVPLRHQQHIGLMT